MLNYSQRFLECGPSPIGGRGEEVRRRIYIIIRDKLSHFNVLEFIL